MSRGGRAWTCSGHLSIRNRLLRSESRHRWTAAVSWRSLSCPSTAVSHCRGIHSRLEFRPVLMIRRIRSNWHPIRRRRPMEDAPIDCAKDARTSLGGLIFWFPRVQGYTYRSIPPDCWSVVVAVVMFYGFLQATSGTGPHPIRRCCRRDAGTTVGRLRTRILLIRSACLQALCCISRSIPPDC